MLLIRHRHLTEISFDAETEIYSGRVTIGYSFPDDPELTHRATLRAHVAKPRQARYSWIEQAVLDAASRQLIDRFAELAEDMPSNIFAADKPIRPILRAA